MILQTLRGTERDRDKQRQTKRAANSEGDKYRKRNKVEDLKETYKNNNYKELETNIKIEQESER